MNMSVQHIEAMTQGYKAGLMSQQTGQKAPVGTVATTGWMHGVGGIFGGGGLEEGVISLRVTPRGLASHLTVVPSVRAMPQFGYITGVEDEGDTEPSTPCATCPSAVMEGCIQSACFGRICRETRELSVSRAIERLDAGDLDLTLLNDMLGPGDPFSAVRGMNNTQILNIATMQAMIETGISMQQALGPMIWQGNPANNVGTGWMEFNGLDTLIGVGKVDLPTGTTCPSLDSDVKEFNFRDISDMDASGNFRIVRDLEYIEAYVWHNADRMGLNPATWAVVMRPELWYELSMLWPIAWMSTRNINWQAGVANSIGQVNYNIDATRVREMVQEMQTGMFIYINGRRHQVILDDGIFEYNSTNDANLAAGEYASNIYFVPLTFLGSRAATFLQHKDYRAGTTDIALGRNQDFYWTDSGRFLWTKERVKFCYTLSTQVEPRIVLKTPQLAGRLNQIKYTPRQHFRSPWSDDDYFVKGGVESRTMARIYPEHEKTRGVIPTDGHCQPYTQ